MALLQDYNKLFEYTDNIKKVILNGNIVWPTGISSTPPGPDYSEPFYVENISNENETLNIVKDRDYSPTLTIEYSTNRTIWQTLGTTSTTALTRTLAPGDKVYLRCNTNAWGTFFLTSNNISGISKVGGNIMSLLYGSNFTGQETSFPSGSRYNFLNLFNFNNQLVDASTLLLPATTLVEGCYNGMFSACYSLTTVPALSATTLAPYCYARMFSSCTELTQAPVLPVTTLADGCYSRMFGGCTSLTAAPALPATTLVNNCYNGMFNFCTSLSNVICFATSGIDPDGSTYNWLYGVSSTGTFTKAAGVSWPTGVNGIPSGWTVVEV